MGLTVIEKPKAGLEDKIIADAVQIIKNNRQVRLQQSLYNPALRMTIDRIRKENERFDGMSQGGTMQLQAVGIPGEIMAVAKQKYGANFIQDDKLWKQFANSPIGRQYMVINPAHI